MGATNKRPAWFLLTQHWLSLLGVALVATALISWLFVLPQQVRGHVDNPYVGIVVFLVLPAIFFAGLALVPIGVYLSKRQIRQGLAEEGFDRKTALQRIAWFFGATTLLNILIGTQVTYRAVKYMETPQFCGASCHTMNPELAAYQNSPHSRVECVECHVAPGAVGWIHSKTSGIRQLVETVLNTSPDRFLPALASNRLVPARETCENCHWPQKFSGARLRLFSKYADDEENTRIGNRSPDAGGWKPDLRNSRCALWSGSSHPFCGRRPKAADHSVGRIQEYQHRRSPNLRQFGNAAGFGQGDFHNLRWNAWTVITARRILSTCRNEPMDKALALGDIAVGLPYIKKKSVELLKANYATSTEAAAKLPPALVSFYQQNYPDLYAARSEDIHQAGQAVLAIYNRNVFPDLKVTWGTYPNNLGHTDFPGCFRCHDGSHTAADGKTITQDCNTCHEPLAMDEASPEILKTLGIAERISKVQKQ